MISTVILHLYYIIVKALRPQHKLQITHKCKRMFIVYLLMSMPFVSVSFKVEG